MSRWAGALAFPLLLGAVVALWLHFQPLSADESGYRIEMDLISPAGGSTWVQYDIGQGRNYRDRRNFWVTQSASPRTYQVPLTSGTFRSLAILPPATVHQVLVGARIIAPDSALVARVPAVRDAPGSDLILIQPARPLELRTPGEKSWAASGLDFALCAGIALLLSTFARRRGGTPLDERCRAAAGVVSECTSARPRATLLAIAALAVAVSCHPVLFFGKSFVSPNNGALCLYDVQPTLPGAPATPFDPWNGSDINATMWAHLPYSVAAHDAVFRDRELPLWNRYVMCGLTLLGQGQSMVGDPLYWVTVCANGAAWAWDLRFLISKLLFSFGLGLVVWRATRHLGIAALLAFSSSFIGFFSFRFNHPAFFSVCDAPWVLLCWLHLAGATTLRRAGWWALGLVGANWLEFNSGTAKEASMLMLGLNGAGALAILFQPEPWKAHLKKLTVAAVSCAIFLAISAPLWVVFLDALKSGYTIYDQPHANQIAPGLLVGLFDDLFFRQLMVKEWHVDPALNFLVLLGLCWAIAGPRTWISEPAARALLVVSGVALAMGFGVVPPALIDQVPFLKNIVHVDDTFICVAIVPLFVLAGFGLRNCLEKMRAPRAWRSDWQVTLLVLGGLAALYFGTVQAVPGGQGFGWQLVRPTEFSPFFIVYAIALFAAVALLPWLVRWIMTGRGSLAAAALAIMICLAVVHFRHGQWLETKFGPYVVTPQQRVDLQAPSAAVNFVRAHQDDPGRVMGFGQILRPGFNIALRLETPTGADAVAVRNLGQWYEAAGLGAIAMWWPTVSKENIADLKPVYDAMNVRYYFGSTADADRSAPGLEKICSTDLEVFESKSPWPRAFFTDRLAEYTDVRQLLRWVKTGDGRPFAAIDMDDGNTIPSFHSIQWDHPDSAAPLPSLGAAPVPDPPARQILAAHDYRLTANTTSFTIDAPAAGVAVLNESFVPDNFRAYINGYQVPYFRVNHISKGVELPGPGTYRIQFVYWPHLLGTTLWIALGGLVLIIASGTALLFVPCNLLSRER